SIYGIRMTRIAERRWTCITQANWDSDRNRHLVTRPKFWARKWSLFGHFWTPYVKHKFIALIIFIRIYYLYKKFFFKHLYFYRYIKLYVSNMLCFYSKDNEKIYITIFFKARYVILTYIIAFVYKPVWIFTREEYLISGPFREL